METNEVKVGDRLFLVELYEPPTISEITIRSLGEPYIHFDYDPDHIDYTITPDWLAKHGHRTHQEAIQSLYDHYRSEVVACHSRYEARIIKLGELINTLKQIEAQNAKESKK